MMSAHKAREEIIVKSNGGGAARISADGVLEAAELVYPGTTIKNKKSEEDE